MKKCKHCNVETQGRKDKVYCSDKCRNTFNNINNYCENLIRVTRKRAIENNIPFNITIEDIFIPELCPILGIPIKRADKYQSNNSPSLDKFIPELGYVKGNVWIVSAKANRLKSNLNKDELIMFCSVILDKLSSM